jgi:hypothetical protein
MQQIEHLTKDLDLNGLRSTTHQRPETIPGE